LEDFMLTVNDPHPDKNKTHPFVPMAAKNVLKVGQVVKKSAADGNRKRGQ
jgi:hypothetical protein